MYSVNIKEVLHLTFFVFSKQINWLHRYGRKGKKITILYNNMICIIIHTYVIHNNSAIVLIIIYFGIKVFSYHVRYKRHAIFYIWLHFLKKASNYQELHNNLEKFGNC